MYWYLAVKSAPPFNLCESEQTITMSEQSKSEQLNLLADFNGLQAEYWDLRGHHHEMTEAQSVSILEAMGYDRLTDENQRKQAIDARYRRDWQQLIPPVLVVKDHEFPRITVCWQEIDDQDKADYQWTLSLENGQQHNGAFRPCESENWGTFHFEDGSTWHRAGLIIPFSLEAGYHTLRLECATLSRSREMRLISAPSQCYQSPALDHDQKHWGASLQLYALHSNRNWGIGDFTDLKVAIQALAAQGASTVGISPVHQLYPEQSNKQSPYSPSSRQSLNPLFLDVEKVATDFDCKDSLNHFKQAEFQQKLHSLRESPLVQYDTLYPIKLSSLRQIFNEANTKGALSNNEDFQAFKYIHWHTINKQAIFEAISGYFYEKSACMSWKDWPAEYHQFDNPAVFEFAENEAETVEFHRFLQWQTHQQLISVSEYAKARGMDLGLYCDLAVGCDKSGGDIWAHGEHFARNASIGAPPDSFSPLGQDWTLLPLVPDHLGETRYDFFINTLRSTMKYAGAMRIDHVLGLLRTFWIPEGSQPKDGAYVRYPFYQLLDILALESHRQQCVIVGEDLGTVPEELRQALQHAGIFSYRVMPFEKDGYRPQHFLLPAYYPKQALTAAATHDLPTLSGFWVGRDIQHRKEQQLFSSESEYEMQLNQRQQDKQMLKTALAEAEIDLCGQENAHGIPTDLTLCVHQYLAKTPCQLMMIQMEDIFEQIEQVNMPGTTTEHINWQRKLAIQVEHWSNDSRIKTHAEKINQTRSL